ncbi:hypothetical protein CYMTET_53438 [Cymbomonas tetramitiformis]|uniref:Pentacotripeptide-repeat region of PRORP domain-containing protein n=1 Tax=Cymbomonas tetramitiformis TaxID=36881 RepID=A0AAE0EQK9_9CHLO|nr:hypothetical protein CYMTET_53438 [Cymbomonas tetramitiformis]
MPQRKILTVAGVRRTIQISKLPSEETDDGGEALTKKDMQTVLKRFDAQLQSGNVREGVASLQKITQRLKRDQRQTNGWVSDSARDKRASAAGKFLFADLKSRHTAVMDACVQEKCISVAFEYVKLFPASSKLYGLLMKACGRLCDYQSARRAFDLRTSELPPDSFAYCGLILAAGRARELDAARDAFHQAEAAGIATTFLYNAFIDACARSHQLEEAFSVWQEMDSAGVAPNTVTFNTLIACAAWCASPERARQVYCQMVADGIPRTERTFGALLSAAASGKQVDLEWAYQVYEAAAKERVSQNNHMLSSLLTCCARAQPKAGPEEGERALGTYRTARAQGLRPNAAVFSALLTLCAKCDRPAEAVQVFEEMLRDGLALDPYCLTSLLTACRNGSQEEVNRAVEVFLDCRPALQHTVVCNAALDLCARQSLPDLAFDIYSQMGVPDIITYNTLIMACANDGDVARAIGVAEDMQAANLHPNERTYGALLHVAAQAGKHEIARHIFEQMRSKGIQPNSWTYTALMDACVKSADPDLALAVFADMKRSGVPLTIVTYGCLMDACSKAGRSETALQVYRAMQEEGVQPNDRVHNVLIRCCSQAGDLEEMMDAMKGAGPRGVKLDPDTYESVVRALCAAGFPQRAMRVYSWMRSNAHAPSLQTTEELVKACCADGQVEWAYRIYTSLRVEGRMVEGAACSELITALCTAVQVDRALQVYEDLAQVDKEGLEPPSIQALCALVEASARLGSLDKALELLHTFLRLYVTHSPSCGGKDTIAPTFSELAFAEPGRNPPVVESSTRIAAEDPEPCASSTSRALVYGEQGRLVLVKQLGDGDAAMMFESLLQKCCRSNRLEHAFEVFDVMKAWKHPLNISTSILAFLEAKCRQSPEHQWRTFDVCAQMRIQRQRKRDMELDNPSKTCHHMSDGRFGDFGDDEVYGGWNANGNVM